MDDANARLAADLEEISRATGRDVVELEPELRPEGAREGTGWTLDAPRLGAGSTAPASDGDGAEAGDPRGEELRDADPRVHAVHPVHGDVLELVGAADLTLEDVLALPGVVAAEPVRLQWPTATDQYQHLQWGLTNTGQTIQNRTGRAGVDVGHAEAGEGIAATVPGYAYMSGTSMATPMVAAAAALVAEPLGSADAALLKQRLLDGMRVRLALGGPLTMLRAHHWTDHGCTSEPCTSTPG